ncbi:hypothetical protein FHR71_005499 [Methylobacterium sp. RAS18]|nr:hypothetical protein [Methylobacterium sp. RAS18]
MMGPRQVEQGALFYKFSLDTHVPADNLLRSIDRFVDLTGLRQELADTESQLPRLPGNRGPGRLGPAAGAA